MASNLILKERIKTTRAKAKELASFVEKSITIAKKNDLNATRRLKELFCDKVAKKLIRDIGLRYRERPGGYTRIFRLGARAHDASPIVIIELVK